MTPSDDAGASETEESGHPIDVRFSYANERAMRRGEPLVPSRIPLILSIGIGVVAVIGVILAMFEGS